MKKSLKLLAGSLALFGMLLTGCDKKADPTKDPEQDPPIVTPEEVKVTGVTVNPKTLTLDVDEEKTLTATVAPSDATNKEVTWITSDKTVATVTNGVVKGVFEGSATITAKTKDGDFTDTCTVTVNEPVAPHFCTHICPICGKCLDATCQDPVCADKCPGHVPTFAFTNGKLTLEAEDGNITGTNTSSTPGESFIGSRNSDNPNHATSGDVVFNWAAAGNKVTWSFKLDAAEAEVGFKLWVATGSQQASSGLSIKVNDQALTWNESSVDGKGMSEQKWYFWQTLTTKGSLVQGTNKIVIENVSGESWNLDVLELANHVCDSICPICGGCLDTECQNPLCATKCPGHNHVCNHVCEFCGKCTDTECQDIVCGQKCPGHNVIEFTNGKYRIPNCNTFGTYEVYAHEAVTIRLEFKANFTSTDNNNDNNASDIYINGAKSSNNKNNHGTADGHAFPGWTIYTSNGTWDLVKGKNTIVLSEPWQSHVTYEWFDIVDATTPVHTCGHVCGDCGGCTDTTCIWYQCASNRCQGHNHECQHVCQYCGKCTDTTCEDLACAQKCAGHDVLDLTSGPMIFESENGYNFVNCSPFDDAKASNGKAVGSNWVNGSSYCFEIAVAEKTSVIFTAGGALVVEPDIEHDSNNNGICEIHIDEGDTLENLGHNDWSGDPAGWSLFKEFVGSKKAILEPGLHVIKVVAPWGSAGNMDYIKISQAPHKCEHVCQFCGKCTDATCDDPVCEQKCSGHNVLDLTTGSMIFEAESGYDFVACGPYENAAASNNGGVGGINGGAFTTGSSYKFEVAVPEDVEVTMVGCGALFEENPANQNGLAKLRIDGAEYGNFGCGAVSAVTQNWHVYEEYANTKVVKLTAGLHTFTVEGEYGSKANVDYIKIVKYVPDVVTKTVTLEAEYGSHSSGLSVLSRNSDTDHKTSNGLCIGGFSDVTGGSLTFNFNASKAGTYKMTVWEANCSNLTSFDSAFTVKVNDATVTASEGTMTACDMSHWYLFQSVKYVDLTLVEGANKIVFTNNGGYGVNIDSIELEVDEDVAITTPNVARVEAELSEIKGTIPGTAEYSDCTLASGTAFYNANEKDSGGASIGNWGNKGDNNLKAYFSVDKDTSVYLVIYLAWDSMSESDMLNKLYGIGVDSCQAMTGLTTTANKDIKGDSTYHEWRAIMRLDAISVTAGEHYINIDSFEGCHINIDCFDIIAVDPTAVVTPLGVHTAA